MTTMLNPRVIRRTAAHFPVRRIGNDYVGVPTEKLFHGEPALTQLFAGISMFFPPGERFMISAIRSVLDDIKDPQLRADVDAFVRQEAQHASEHTRANAEMAAITGKTPDELCREIVVIWDLIERYCSPRHRVAFTAAVEHFTAVISEVLLADLEMVGDVRADQIRQMFVWHGIEECEHKAVAFDAFREIGGTELERIAAMLLFTGPAFVTATLPFLRLLAAHGELTNLRSWAGLTRAVGGRWGGSLLRRYAAWYRPGFHPTHLPTRHIELYWREQLNADLPMKASA